MDIHIPDSVTTIGDHFGTVLPWHLFNCQTLSLQCAVVPSFGIVGDWSMLSYEFNGITSINNGAFFVAAALCQPYEYLIQ
jgi:hypothetical protein